MIENLHINSFLVEFPDASHNTLDGFTKAKKLYTKRILDFFRVHNYIAATNFVGDVEVYVKCKDEKYGDNSFALFNRFGLKISYNHIYQQPNYPLNMRTDLTPDLMVFPYLRCNL